MAFQLLHVDPKVDFPELIACQWAAFESPPQPYFQLVCPIHGAGPAARAESLAESTARQLAWFRHDPATNWLKVVTGDGRIVGGAIWKIYKENPFAAKGGGARPAISWYPEGPQRDYVAAALAELDKPRRKMAARPQLYMNNIFTHPEFRRQGVADLLMSWGTKKADALGLEGWVNASGHGQYLYKKHGFVAVDEMYCCPETDSPSEEWEEIKSRMTPMFVTTMWRPIGGKCEPGITQ